MLLSPIHPSDTPDFERSLLSWPERLDSGVPRPKSPSNASSWVRRAVTRMQQRRDETYCIRLANLQLAGVVSLALLDPQSPVAELSYWVAPPFRGRRLATRACASILNARASDLAPAGISAHAHKLNTASLRLLRRLGFRRNSSSGPIHHFFRASAAHIPSENPMFTLQPAQIASLRQSATADYIDSVAAGVRSRYPDCIQGLTAAELKHRIFTAMLRAQRYGIQTDPVLRSFLYLTFCTGPYFDCFPRFQDIFCRTDISPDRKLGLVLETAGQLEWSAASAQTLPEVAR